MLVLLLVGPARPARADDADRASGATWFGLELGLSLGLLGAIESWEALEPRGFGSAAFSVVVPIGVGALALGGATGTTLLWRESEANLWHGLGAAGWGLVSAIAIERWDDARGGREAWRPYVAGATQAAVLGLTNGLLFADEPEAQSVFQYAYQSVCAITTLIASVVVGSLSAVDEGERIGWQFVFPHAVASLGALTLSALVASRGD